jgi:hypothetical protein
MKTVRLHLPFSLLPTLLALALPLAFCATRAEAQVTVLFTPNIETGMPGDTLNYTATFTDTDMVPYYIDGAGFTSLDPNASLLYPLFNGDPVNGDRITGNFEIKPNVPDTVSDVFWLSLDPTIPNGTYLGTVSFTGQTEADYTAGTGTDTVLGSQDITAQVNSVSAVPEPSSLALFGFGSASLVALAYKRRSQATT